MIGRVIGARYRLEKKLGSGAMGSVYRARHVKVGRAFAIKILHLDLLDDSKLKRRFVREAELAGTLKHTNTVTVVDVDEFEGLHYIAMEYAEGPTLGDIISSQAPLPAPRAIALVQQLCDGLHHAHEKGLIHRDFKPDNVIVEAHDAREVPRIVDFGIAIVRDDASSAERERLTTAGITLGTPHYMAPEHVTGQAIDHRIDLFALGVVMYEMLSGAMPFDGDGVDVARANLLEDTPPMSVRAPNVDVDPLLEAFTRKLLSKAPDARFASARAARDVLTLIARDRKAAAAALGVAVDDALPTPPPRADVPRFGQHTPPTPFLAIPKPLEYSPSGQHVVHQRIASPRGALAPLARTPTGSEPPLTRPVTAPPVARAPTAQPVRSSRIWIAIAAAVAALALGALLAVLVG
jgi:serine/threonine-protein kinase